MPSWVNVRTSIWRWTFALAALEACGPEASEGPRPQAPLSFETTAAPLSIGGRCTAPSLAAGDNHTCLVGSGGTVACWGANASHQVGVATPTYVLSPTEVPGVTGAVAVTAGSGHTCALIDSGTVVCWGSNNTGQLGDGLIERTSVPITVPGLSGITAIAAGSVHTCALRNDGTVWCWGSNSSGRLGDGTTVRRVSPVAVHGLTDVKTIVAGASHTCALTSGGEAYCWGGNSYGQLGDGTKVARRLPTLVSADMRWRSLSAGQTHTCGVLQAPGNPVYCWGRNHLGQVGDGSILTYVMQPTAAVDASGAAVTDGVMVSVGGATSCLVRGDGTAACWGSNAFGQIGDGTMTSPRRAPASVTATAPLANAFLLVTNGVAHTCALAVSGEVYCWGTNGSGQLGNGTRIRKLVPTRVGSSVGLTFAPFSSEDDRTAVNGASATSLAIAGDTLLAAGVERGAGGDSWVVRRGRDRGANWTTAASYTFASGTAMQAPHLVRTSSGTLFLAGAAANDDGDTAWVVRRSADGGDAWSEVANFIFDRGHAASLRALTTDRRGRIFAAGSADDASGAHWLVRATADDGATWFVADDYAATGAEARAVLDAGSAGFFAIGHAVLDGHAHLRVRTASSIVESDRATLWSDGDDFQYESGYDTFGEAAAADLGGRVFVLARANGADGWRFVLRVFASGAWSTASTFQLAAGAETSGYKLLVDRAGTLHVAGAAARSGETAHGIVASSYDHGATWLLSDELGSDSALTDLVEDATGALHAAGSVGTGASATWTVRSRSCTRIAQSCGNWIIDHGELCDGDCSDCNDHDVCTTDVMAGSASSCNVQCTNTPITACVSGDGCCAPGCTSDLDIDCCTGPIENGACVDLSFRIDLLASSGCTTIEHSQVTGTSRGALAVSTSNVFYTGNGPTNRGVTGRFNATDLSSGRATTYVYENIFSDLRSGTVYTLGSGNYAMNRAAGVVTTLVQLNPATGAPTTPRITLSRQIQITSARAFFSGYGRVLLHNGARLYDIQLPSGRVTDLGSMVLPTRNTCANAATYGVAEAFGGALYLDYVSGAEIKRTRVPDGQTTTVQAFTDLGTTCALALSTGAKRWYFEHSGASEFASGTATLGTCPAVFRRPNAPPVCGNAMLEAGELCDGDCAESCDDGDSCTTDVQTGSASTCNMACTHPAVTTCHSGDGCCVAGCNAVEDADCPSTCGNTVVEPGETCDGNCPASCGDGDACTTDTSTGLAASCDFACHHTTVTACQSGDGCCPAGCTAALDNDCAPVPVLTSISPSQVVEGSSTLTLTLVGTGLIEGARASFDGSELTTTRISDTELRITIAAASLTSVATHTVSVTTFGGTTDTRTLSVVHPAPSIVSVTPAAGAEGASATLTITGTGFVSGAVASFNTTPLSTTFVSATQLQATLPAQTPGGYLITVANPSPAAGPSNSFAYTINGADPYWSNVVLLLRGEGTNGSTTITDSSLNQVAYTSQGVTNSNVHPRYGSGCLAFASGGGYLTGGNISGPLTGPFTIESWVYLTDSTHDYPIFQTAGAGYGSGVEGFGVYAYKSFGLAYVLQVQGFTDTAGFYTGVFPSVNTWHHVALTRDASNVIRFYIDGVSTPYSTDNQYWLGHPYAVPDATTLFTGAGVATNNIGATVSSGPGAGGGIERHYNNGFLDDLRITRSVARYTTSSFAVPGAFPTQPTTASVDPNFSSVALLMHGEGTNGSTTITNSASSHSAYTSNGVTVSTARSRFGSGSVYFGATGGYLSGGTIGSPLTGPFTIESWIYLTDSTHDYPIFQTAGAGYGSGVEGFGVYAYKSFGLAYVVQVQGFTDTGGFYTGVFPSVNTWHHVAITRDASNVIRFYIDGVSTPYSTDNQYWLGHAYAVPDATTAFTGAGVSTNNIGGTPSGGPGAGAGVERQYNNGYLDELRISRVARYTTSTFLMTLGAFPDQ